MVLAVMVWMGLADLGATRWFAVWPVLGTAGWVLTLRNTAGPVVYRFRREHLLLGMLAVVVIYALADVFSYYDNGVRTEDGGLQANLYHDVRLHLAIVEEIRHTWPPQVPFLAGAPLRYHVGMDVLANVYLSTAPFEPMDLVDRFLPTVLFGLLVLGAYALGHRVLGSRLSAVWFAALVVFGDDFFGIAKLWEPDLSATLYYLPTLYSIFLHNPNLHGLVVALAGLVASVRFLEAPSARTLAPTAVLFAGSMLFKVFFAANILAALGIVGVFQWLRGRDRRVLAAAAAVCAAMIPVLWLMRHGLQNGRNEFGIRALPGLAHPLWFLWLTLGMRWLALPALVRAFRRPADPADPRPMLAVFVAAGTLMGLFVRVGTIGQPWNNGIWFFVATKYLVWLFVLETVGRIRPAFVRYGVLTLTLAVAVYPGVLFLRGYATAVSPGVRFSPADYRLIEWTRGAVPAGDVVLLEADFPIPLTALTQCRTFADPVLGIFAPSFMTPEESASRERDSLEFWKAWDAGKYNAEVVARRGVNFLIVRPALRPADPLRDAGTLPAYDDGTHRVYDLREVVSGVR